jgi:CIC family chloride channel protein
LVGCIMAHALTVLLLRRSILTEKVARRGYHIAREYSVDPLAGIRVGEVMDRNVPVIPSSIPLAELSERLARRDPQLGPHHAHLLVDEEGALVGIVTRGDIVRALDSNPGDNPPVMQVASHNLIVTYPDEILQEAVAKMVRNSLGRLPVVSRENPNRPVGYLGRSNVLSGRLRSLEDEQVRERGLGGRVARPAHA